MSSLKKLLNKVLFNIAFLFIFSIGSATILILFLDSVLIELFVTCAIAFILSELFGIYIDLNLLITFNVLTLFSLLTLALYKCGHDNGLEAFKEITNQKTKDRSVKKAFFTIKKYLQNNRKDTLNLNKEST